MSLNFRHNHYSPAHRGWSDHCRCWEPGYEKVCVACMRLFNSMNTTNEIGLYQAGPNQAPELTAGPWEEHGIYENKASEGFQRTAPVPPERGGGSTRPDAPKEETTCHDTE